MTDILLAHLPPVRWGDVVTQQGVKQDLEHQADRLRAEFQRELRMAISEQTRTLVWTQVGTMLTVTILAFGAARLI